MKFTELGLAGVWLIEPELFRDERGAFRRTYCSAEFAAHGLAADAVQGNVSENPHEGTLRGFHFQAAPFGEAKTLTCFTGSLFDIVLDLRPESQTFRQWISVEVSSSDRRMLHVPAGCANAWLTTAPDTLVHYYMSAAYRSDADRGLRYNDPAFGFRWPREPIIISRRDANFPNFDPSSLISD
ncbi:MAG: dTDP-4-dehydrorhamnose 3,5-epimerase family protein [Gemmatimonadetes bacterium]|nr:dTDP-4-dehydrorhamnose 3,5-epimerase family protein [Gemmatimonadota bacterium]